MQPIRDQQRRRKPAQLGRERRQRITASPAELVFDRNIPADDKALLLQSLQERGPQRYFGLRGALAEISDDRQALPGRGPKRRKRGGAAQHEECRAGSLLDDLVGAQQHRMRNRQSERLGRLEVDDQLEARGLHDRQIGGGSAL